MKFFCLLLLVIPAAVAAQPLNDTMEAIRRAYHIPEIGCAVVTPSSSQIAVAGYHRVDHTDHEDANIHDLIHLGSNSKAITGFVAAQFVARGSISWDTRLLDVYPEWRSKADTAYQNITLKDLLSHRARIQPFTHNVKGTAPTFKGDAHERRLQFGAYLLTLPPAAAGKSSYNYSNAGYTLAALMLEKISGKSWEELVTQSMAAIGIKAGFGWPNKTDTLQPWGHWVDSGKLVALPPDVNYDLDLIQPAGDIKMSLTDYARFIQLNLVGLKTDTVITKEAFQFLHRGLPDYAIGWANGVQNGKRYCAHSGSAGTFFVTARIDEDEDKAWIVFANAADQSTQDGLNRLLRYLRSTGE